MGGQSRFYQLRFPQQRAEFARGFFPFEPMDLLRQPQLARCAVFRVEMAGDARPQIDALADVDRMLIQSVKQIYARCMRQRVDRIGRQVRRQRRPPQQRVRCGFDLSKRMAVRQALQPPPQHTRITKCAMSLLTFQVEPIDEHVQRVRRAVRVQIAAEPDRAQRLGSERQSSAVELGAQESVVETRVVGDEDCAVEPIEYLLRYLGERWCRAHHIVGDAGQPLNLGGDRHDRVDQRRPLFNPNCVAVKIDAHHADFGHALARWTRSCRFDINECQTWCDRGKHSPNYRLGGRAYCEKREAGETDMTSPEADKAARLEAVGALIDARSQKSERASLTIFARAYFERVDPEDIAVRSAEDLYGALLSHWQFARKREAGAIKVRVFNPGAGEHGWASRHTVVEIVNDDMPFLVDSASMEVNRQGLALHLIVHPIFAVERDKSGTLQTIDLRSKKPDWPRESFMHIEVDRLADPTARAELAAGIERALGDVRASVADWKAMIAQLRAVIEEVDRQPPPLPREEIAENRAFLQWLTEDHLLLLGYRRHDLATVEGQDALRLVPGSGLGILRESATETALSSSFAVLPREARAVARSVSPMLFVTKANSRSTVHRPGYIDYIGVKRYQDGVVIGEHRFVGLFTSAAYNARVAEVPLIRGKVSQVAARSGIAPGSHLGKAMAHVLETYPRDELFQITADELHEIATGIVQLGERQRFRLFIRRDPFERFVSCLIFVPRENYTTELRRRFQKILIDAFDGSTADFDVLLTDAVLARIHITVRTTPGNVREVDRRAIETQLADVARRWEDDLRQALNDEEGEARAAPLYKRFGSAFPTAYEEAVSPREAVADIRRLDTLESEAKGGLALNLYRPLGGPHSALGFKLYRSGAPIALSDSLPMLERMGVRVLSERGYQVMTDAGRPLWVHDFSLQLSGADDIDAEAIAPLFEESFARVFEGAVENDDFNRLVLRAGLSADEIVVLRAYAKVMRQTGFALSQTFIETTLATHPRIARMLVALFKLRFDPAHSASGANDRGAAASQVNAIEQALDKVSNLSEDKVLRQYLALIGATLRTNYWRTGVGTSGAVGPRRAFLSFKFDSAQIPGLPEPRPLFEIFVYSVRFEGVHLRGGKVARGGLRWSDRPEDFRTEVLGLVKAQMVKNTVIVPVGSKGGFVLKKAPPMADREAYLKEGVDCYRDYLRGLLDLTDNRVGDAIVPPPHVVRHDAADPYLVVAADKGTATFSDYANAVSAEYGFWLGDAFASGGSAGYDHKEMGITARGAWESVKRHFRELGINTQTTEFTCVGIGDMSGDVFGNGMLLSRHIRLLAAFDHRHIFIDPAPDVAASFAERERLYALPRSSWADYNQKLISPGGGIWARSEKSIRPSSKASILPRATHCRWASSRSAFSAAAL